jgi:hypothetical protein
MASPKQRQLNSNFGGWNFSGAWMLEFGAFFKSPDTFLSEMSLYD